MSIIQRNAMIKIFLPFLDPFENEINGNHMPRGFYDTCRELAKYDEENGCYIFDDAAKLFDFSSRQSVPSDMSDYITEYYNDDTPIFIIWSR